MDKDDRAAAEIQFGDHTEIKGDLVAGDQVKVSTGTINAEDNSTVNVAGHDIIQVNKGGIVLVNSGSDQLDLPKLQAAANANKLPDYLYYSVNCELQIDQLEETLVQQGGKPCCMLACMVHGDINQAPEMFLKRIRVEILPQILDLDQDKTPIAVYELPWPGRLPSLEDLPRLLEKNLAKNVLEDSRGTKGQISQRFATFQGPILIQTYIYQGDFQRWGVKVLEAFIKFWMDWPEMAPSQRILIFVCIQYQPSKQQAFFNRLLKRDPRVDFLRFIKKIATEPSGPSYWFGLPPIDGANLQDATNWARREEISEQVYSDLIVNYLQQYYLKKSSQSRETVLIPIAELADELMKIVPKYFRF